MERVEVEKICDLIVDARNHIAKYLELLADSGMLNKPQRYNFFYTTLKVLISELIVRCIKDEEQENIIKIFLIELKEQIAAFNHMEEKREVTH